MEPLKKLLNNVNKSVDIVIYINGYAVGGQEAAQLSQTRNSIDITNRINGEWVENLSGIRSWSLSCNGLYVVGASALAEIQSAFLNDIELTVALTIDKVQYRGKALITDFPLSISYDSALQYSLILLGTGPLKPVE